MADKMGMYPKVFGLLTLGTIHILRKHFYSTKLNLTSKFFTRTGFFSSKQRNFFFNITFSCCSLKFLADKEENSQKIRENVVVDKKKCLRNI